MMASAPVKDHVFYVATMQELQTLLQRIGESSCKSKLKGDEVKGDILFFLVFIQKKEAVLIL